MTDKDDAIEIDGVRLTSPGKVLYPEQGITKEGLAEYYMAVAEHMLPHVSFRPITLVRCPAGRAKKCFYQRHAGSGVLPQLDTVDITGFEDSGAYLYIKDRAGLVAMVQMGVLEMHPWGARIDRTDRPDRVVFDLDPGEDVAFAAVIEAAIQLRDFLQDRGLTSFVKTSGGKGLHVALGIARQYDWATVKSFAKTTSDQFAGMAPERFLTRISKAERKGRIFIDYLRNDPTSTAVAPYSTRSREGAPVATPLDWSELGPRLDAAAFTVTTVPQRLRKLKIDPWAQLLEAAQRLPAA